MRINYISHHLKELKANMDTIEAYIYANLGRVDNFTLSDDELFNKVNYQFRMFKARYTNLQLELDNERKRESK